MNWRGYDRTNINGEDIISGILYVVCYVLWIYCSLNLVITDLIYISIYIYIKYCSIVVFNRIVIQYR